MDLMTKTRKRGRPPIGTRAMTASERQARYLARKYAAIPADPLFDGCLTVEDMMAELPTSFRQLAEDEVAKSERDAEGNTF